VVFDAVNILLRAVTTVTGKTGIRSLVIDTGRISAGMLGIASVATHKPMFLLGRVICPAVVLQQSRRVVYAGLKI